MDPIIRVKFFSSFCSSRTCLTNYSKFLDLFKPDIKTEKIIFTDQDDYTHAVILNTAMLKLVIPKEHVLGLAFEPPVFLQITDKFIKYAQKHIAKYYIGKVDKLPLPFQSFHGFMWFIKPPILTLDSSILNYQTSSQSLSRNFISIIISDKRITTGHRYRYHLIKKIISYNLPIDIWGNGCRTVQNMIQNKNKKKKDSLEDVKYRVLGQFQEIEPYLNYRFTIANENVSLLDYFSEKLLNPLVFNVTPIYYGCRRIENYFPDSTINLSGDLSFDMDLIQKIINQPNLYQKDIDRNKILETVDLKKELHNLWMK